jgi:hypothetical protein
MPSKNSHSQQPQVAATPLVLRFEISEAAIILRMSRAQVYKRINSGALRVQKDGARTYVTRVELERYVESCSNYRPTAD